MTAAPTVLVTGGAGFIGGHVVPMLVDRGHRVRVLDSMVRGDRDRVQRWVSAGQVELIEQDIRYGNAAHRAVEGCDAVVHLAAVASIDRSMIDPLENIDVNVVGTTNLLDAAAQAGVRRFVYASSASVYGNPVTLPMHEDDRLSPITPYCIAKLSGEHLAQFFATRSAMTWIGLRLFNVYGPGQKVTAYYTSVINHFLARLRAGSPPVIDGAGEQSMDFVHVHDVARAVVLALEVDPARANTAVNVGTGVSTTIADLARTLIAVTGADVEPQFAPRDVLVTRREAHIGRAADVLGWAPTIDLRTGMADLVQHDR